MEMSTFAMMLQYLNLKLFLCFGASSPTGNFSPVWRRPHYRTRATIFYLHSTLIAFEKRGILNVPHLLLHEPTIHNGHLQEPVTLTPVGKGAVTPWHNDQ